MTHTQTPPRLVRKLRTRPSDALDALVTAVCALVLLAFHIVAGYFALLALIWVPEGPWDHSADDDVRALCTGIVVIETIAGAATAGLMKAGVLRTWWYAIPTVLVAIAALRYLFPPAG